MQLFATLLNRLTVAQDTAEKRRLLTKYLTHAPDPDRGYALALIAGDITLPKITPASLRALIKDRVDTKLFEISQSFVGDLAETVSLLWPQTLRANRIPPLHEILEHFQNAPPTHKTALLAELLDTLPSTERWALLKLCTGGHTLGLSSREAKCALSDLRPGALSIIEEAWHATPPPYTALFAWLEGNAAPPALSCPLRLRPVMQANAATPAASSVSPDTHAADWVYDGAPVQLSCADDTCRLYTHDGDDISAAFPDIIRSQTFSGTLDATLLVRAPGGGAAPFSALQKRLGRKTAPKKLQESHPAFVIAHDALQDRRDDLRGLPFVQRRKRLEALLNAHPHPALTLSELTRFETSADLETQRAIPPLPAHLGLRLKKWASLYTPEHPQDAWQFWAKDPHTINAVLLYAAPGATTPARNYTALTFGVWRDETHTKLVRIGTADLSTTSENHAALDAFVKTNTAERFGPVRSVIANAQTALILQITFDALLPSGRHKAGFILRNARIADIKWELSASQGITLEMLHSLEPSVRTA